LKLTGEVNAKPLASWCDRVVATLTPYMNWRMRLSQKLRHMRNTGYSPREIEQLRIGAIEGVRTVYERNGWGEPHLEADIGRLGI